jgi:hypothetical protein
MGRRWLVLVVAGLLAAAAAGCFSPPPPQPTQVCGQGFGSASQYQAAFYNLGQAGTGWITADGFVPAALSGGGEVRWMSDTMTGAPNPDNSVTNPGNVHNSTVEQGGGCSNPHLGVIPQSGNAWYWPGSTVVVGNTLDVFSHKVVAASGPPGFDFQVVATSVAYFSLPWLQLIDGPTDLPLLSNQASGGEPIPFGIRSFYNANENMIYLYGQTGGLFTANSWLARAPAGQETDVAPGSSSPTRPAPTHGVPISPTPSPWSSPRTGRRTARQSRN